VLETSWHLSQDDTEQKFGAGVAGRGSGGGRLGDGEAG